MKNNKKLSIMSTILFAAALPFVVSAAAIFDAHAAAAEQSANAARLSPTESVRQTIDAILKVLMDEKYQGPQKKQERLKILENIVAERFDYPEMSQRVLGQQWKALNQNQKEEFTSLFQKFLSVTYAAKVEEYSGEAVKYGKERIADKVYAEVQTSVDYKGSTIPINYRLMNKDGDWRAYDVVIDGISMVNNYRGQFNKIIQHSGYPALLDQLREKIRKNNETAAVPSAPIYLAGTGGRCC